jgi:hypothetical protein
MNRALLVAAMVAGFVLFVGYSAARNGLDGPCDFRASDPEGSGISSGYTWWPPGAVKCVTELPDGSTRTETFPRDGYWYVAAVAGIIPLALWRFWLRGRSPASWTQPWQRRLLRLIAVGLRLTAIGLGLTALGFFALLLVIPPMGPILAVLSWWLWRWSKELKDHTSGLST